MNNGKRQVRIRIRVAMSRKMFGACENTIVLQCFHVKQRFCSYRCSIITKGAAADNGVQRIVVDVGNRSKINMHAKPLALVRNFRTHTIDVSVESGSGHRHLSWKTYRTVNTHGKSPFGIHANEQRNPGQALILIVEYCLSYRSALEKN